MPQNQSQKALIYEIVPVGLPPDPKFIMAVLWVLTELPKKFKADHVTASQRETSGQENVSKREV